MNPEADQFADYNRNITNSTVDSTITFWFLTRQLLKVLISVAAITCNTLIIYATAKLKKTQDLKFLYLLLWSVLDIVCSLISPYMPLLVNAVAAEEVEYEGVICWVLQLESAVLFLVYITVILLSVDWIIENFFGKYYQAYKDKQIFIRIFYYTFTVLYLWYASMYCLSNWREIHHVTILNTLKFLIVYLIALHVFTYLFCRFKNFAVKTDFGIVLPTIFVSCWLPYLIAHTLISGNQNLLICSYFFAQCFAFSNAIFNVYYLGKSENQFREKFLEFVKCQCRHEFWSKCFNCVQINGTKFY